MFGKLRIQNPANDKLSTQWDIPLTKKKPISKPSKQQKRTHHKDITAGHRTTNQLQGAKFRILNQLLYTKSSSESLNYFQQHSEDFAIYHQGFKSQAAKWPQNPLHTIIAYLKQHHANRNKLILDLGCGQGELHQTMTNIATVRSFDLVATKPFIEVSDIANLPIQAQSADVCVFCLSLMGTNYIKFLRQARRVLKPAGELLIAEVESRCKQWRDFVEMVEKLGFRCHTNRSNSYFRFLYFSCNFKNTTQLTIRGTTPDIDQYSKSMLTSCQYKRR